MYYAQFDNYGNRIASYHSDIHDGIPTDSTEISNDDQNLYATNEYIRGADGKPQKKPAYVPTLADSKITKWNSIKSTRDTLEQSGVSYMGKILDSDTLSVQRITIAIQAAQAALSAGQPLTLDWTTQDNTVLTMTAQEVCGIPVALAMHSDNLHQIARGLRERIELAQTKEEIDVIVWPV